MQKIKPRVLVVDDVETNRIILKKILQEDYEIVEASNGQEAMGQLEKLEDEIDAMLLDIRMPIMNGFQVLEAMGKDSRWKNITILVVTENQDEESEIQALDLGATDYITKPYNPKILRHRLSTLMDFQKRIITYHVLERDSLTGLYNKVIFERETELLLERNKSKVYQMICINIEKFKVINDLYGAEAGNRLLRRIAVEIQKDVRNRGGIAGRIGGDHFALCIPEENADPLDMTEVKLSNRKLEFPVGRPLVLGLGIYRIVDRRLSVSGMYDRAELAVNSIRGNYKNRLAVYQEEMILHLRKEQMIASEMERALKNGEFILYCQPKYNLMDYTIAGVENLVRWKHPIKGILSPAEFIPIFEKNGFITKIDYFIWEESCKRIREWMDTGLEPVPMAVNVSRVDIYQEDLREYLNNLVKKYDIPKRLLELEITESSYAENTQQIIRVVKELKEDGFFISMDDFGSGYSSLNMLNELPVDRIKLDLRFLNNDGEYHRTGNLINSMISMARWLDLPVIAEGIETKEQMEFLRSAGCHQGQGNFFAKAMPEEEMRQRLKEGRMNLDVPYTKLVTLIDVNEFNNPKSSLNMMFNSFVGALAIFELDGENCSIIRGNNRFFDMFDVTRSEIVKHFSNVVQYVHPSDKEKFRILLKSAEEEEVEVVGDIRWLFPAYDILKWFHMHVKLIMKNDERRMFLSTIEDSTKEHETEAEKEQLLERLLESEHRCEEIIRSMKMTLAAKADDLKEKNYLKEGDSNNPERRSRPRSTSREPLRILGGKELKQAVEFCITADPKEKDMLFIIDIDNFKQIRDSQGHAFANLVLNSVAEEIRQNFRADDILGKTNEEEFVVYIRNIQNAQFAKRKAEEILLGIHKIFHQGQATYNIAGSIGIAAYPKDGDTFESLFNKAAAALYYGKKDSKKRYALYGDK